MARRVALRAAFASSEEKEHTAKGLGAGEGDGWTSERFASFPQCLVFEMFDPRPTERAAGCCFKLSRLKIMGHEFKIPSKIDVFTGSLSKDHVPASEDSASWYGVNFKALGHFAMSTNEESHFKAMEQKSVELRSHSAAFLKLVLHRPHPNPLNIYSQASLRLLEVYGTVVPSKRRHDDRSRQEPATSAKASVTKTLTQASVTSSKAQEQEREMLARIDAMTAEKIELLNAAKVRAVRREQYDFAKMLKGVIDDLKEAGMVIAAKEKEKIEAVMREDYDTAGRLRDEVDDMRFQAYSKIPELDGAASSSFTSSTSSRKSSVRLQPIDTKPEVPHLALALLQPPPKPPPRTAAELPRAENPKRNPLPVPMYEFTREVASDDSEEDTEEEVEEEEEGDTQAELSGPIKIPAIQQEPRADLRPEKRAPTRTTTMAERPDSDKFIKGRAKKNFTLSRKEQKDILAQQKAAQVRQWVQEVVGREVSEDMHEALGDGTVLCEIANKMFAGIIPRVFPPDSAPFQLRENIVHFLGVAEQLGVPTAFNVEDLFMKKNMIAVYHTIESIAIAAEDRGFPVKWSVPLELRTPRKGAGGATPRGAPAVNIMEFAEQKEAEVEAEAPAAHVPTPPPAVAEQSAAERKLADVRAEAAASETGETPLHIAVQSRDTLDVVDLLLKDPSGCEVDAKDKEGNTPLHVAVLHSVPESTQRVLQAGADPNIKTKDGFTALHLAVVREDMQVIEAVLRSDLTNKTAPDDKGNTPLHLAIAEGSDEAALKLVAYPEYPVGIKNKVGDTPLHVAAAEGKEAVIKALVAKGASLEDFNHQGEVPLHRAADAGESGEVLKTLSNEQTINARRKDGSTPLHAAVTAGSLEAVSTLVELGADVNAQDDDHETPVMLAAAVGNETMLRAMKVDLDKAYEQGRRALYQSCYEGNVVVADKLCRRGAKVDSLCEHGWAPLHAAAYCGKLGCLELLVEKYKASIDVLSTDRSTPLVCAALKGNSAAVLFLLKKGASAVAANADGWTALHAVTASPDPKIWSLVPSLLDAGASPVARCKAAKGYTPLHMAIAHKLADTKVVMQLAHAAKKEGLSVTNDNGLTALHAAAAWNNVEVVGGLCELGADLEAATKQNRKPIHLALYYGHDALAKVLADKMKLEQVPRIKVKKEKQSVHPFPTIPVPPPPPSSD